MQRLFTFILIAAFACGCAKTSSIVSNLTGNIPPGSGDNTAAVTDIGTPVGDPITKTIGAAGGTIISADGRAELNIPAGALSSDLAISIQPITNEMPNGVGIAYDFLPNGTKFLTPAVLTFHYTDDDVNGTDPYLINMATQDSLNEWEADIYKDVDTVAKTIVFDIEHFSPKGFAADIKVQAPPKLSSLDGTDFYENDHSDLVVSQGVTPAQRTGDSDPALAFTLPKPKPVSDDKVSNWTLTAGSDNGSLSATKGSTVTYTAPGTITKDKTVTASVKVSLDAVSMSRKKQKSSVSSGSQTLSIRLHLHPTIISYSVKVNYNIPDISGYSQQYHDEAVFEVDIKSSKIITIPALKIQNEPPSVTPPYRKVGKTESQWKADPFGIVNVVGGTGSVSNDPTRPGQKIVDITLTNDNNFAPAFKITDPSGLLADIPGGPVLGWPLDFVFDLVDGDPQVIDANLNNPFKGQQTVTITRIH
jgi:hypothetical protein